MRLKINANKKVKDVCRAHHECEQKGIHRDQWKQDHLLLCTI